MDDISNQMLRGFAAEGLQRSILSPRHMPMMQRTAVAHIYLCQQAGIGARPKDFTTLCGCNPETSRLFMRKGERDGLLKIVSDAPVQIEPTKDLVALVDRLETHFQRCFPVGPPKLTARSWGSVLLSQTFSIRSIMTPGHQFIFKSLVRRSIAAMLVLAGRQGTTISEKSLRRHYNISAEGLRLFKHDLLQTDLVVAEKRHRSTGLTASPALIDLYVSHCRNAVETVEKTTAAAKHKYPKIFQEVLHNAKSDRHRTACHTDATQCFGLLTQKPRSSVT